MMVLMQTDLPAPVAPAINIWGARVRSMATGAPAVLRPSGRASLPPSWAKALLSKIPRNVTVFLSGLGTSMPT